uniref:NADH dehydrogenase [ubiquinone] iron-sulfur protein 4, mitochondrial n=1 Tax=Cajanus cajan TaxID=3821 RepID=A0A151RXU9_CAJCA|nr:hypothetical protein KK1_030996 [Cajanus cajan]
MARRFSTDALVEIKPGEIGIVSGIPQEHLRRRVFYSFLILFFYLLFLILTGLITGWENPLMGWTSTGDPYAHVGDSAMTFDSAEAAKAFAEKHGWEYTVYLALQILVHS